MKNKNYEKKYKEALEKARQLCDYPTTKPFISDLQDIFPELKESKGNEDKRIRKAISDILLIDSDEIREILDSNNVLMQDIDTWLEKQDKHLENYDEAEKEKAEFVSDGFIECHADFLDFKEGNTYWLEYIGDDKYNVRSDNLLGKTYHITPCQLYTVFKKLTWLEKQGELKPQGKTALEAIKEEKVDNQNCVKSADEVEPKFHEGEWITNGDYTWRIVEVKPLDYILQSQDGNIVDDTIFYVDEQFHSFAIEDAKDGDVLFIEIDASTCIFKKFEENLLYSYIISDGKLLIEDSHYYYETSDNVHPATKEQRDLLFQKMKEAGYEWDFEKKELKKIENKNPLLSDFFKAEYERGKADAQKPDGCSENKRLHTINVYYPNCCLDVKEAIEQGIACCKTEKKEILISLNGIFLRITPSSTTENVLNEYNNCTGNSTVIKDKTNLINQWNSNDDSYLKGIITDIECEVSCANCSREIADLKINWLKSLKGRVQPQVEWGEWGKKYIASTIKMVEHCSFSSIGGITKAAAITWLKSLKDRYTWKPSDEQMKALWNVYQGGREQAELATLYNDLKKLRKVEL